MSVDRKGNQNIARGRHEPGAGCLRRRAPRGWRDGTQEVSQIAEVFKKHDVVAQGWWAGSPGHVFYLLVDAPNAYASNSFVVEFQLFKWNIVDIHPTITVEEAMLLAAW